MTTETRYVAHDDIDGVWIPVGWHDTVTGAQAAADEVVGHDDYALYMLAPPTRVSGIAVPDDLSTDTKMDEIDDHIATHIEGQRIDEYRDRGDGQMELELSNGVVIQEDGVWVPKPDTGAPEGDDG